jgi:NAD(P)-dependent dehydrogenase (short-subunit alcohol dehydrogenase family)
MYRATPKDGIAWITGASTGIGRAVVLELVRRGWKVAATARNVQRLGTLTVEAEALGGTVIARPGDITDEAAMAALIATIEREDGPIALAMLNAGGFFPDAPGEFVGANFRKTMTLNADGTLNSLEPLLPAMTGRGRGQIAVVSYVAGYGGLPTAASYCMAKSGLIAMCESLKPALERVGLSIQIICPGYVRTPLSDQVKGPRPFLVEVDDAACRICDGFERGGFEIAFPRRMVWLVKALHRLPYPIYFWLGSRASGRYA